MPPPGPPVALAMNSALEDVQEADAYISELRRRCERQNDAPEGKAFAPSLLFMIPVLVSYFLL